MTSLTGHPPVVRRAAAWGITAWRRWTTPYDTAHPDAAAFRSLQVQATIALTPWAVFANWANLAVAGWTFREAVDQRLLLLWVCLLYTSDAADE